MAQRSEKTAQVQPPRRAMCTHIAMARLHGSNVCQLCGKTPDVGWLYACRQDWLTEYQDSMVSTADIAITVPDDSNYFDVMARRAASLKMSPSVTKQIREGFYTFDQVEKLVAQKEHLISTIKGIEGSSLDHTPASRSCRLGQSAGVSNIVASLGVSANAKKIDQRRSDGSPIPDTTKQANAGRSSAAPAIQPSQSKVDSCNFMACHTCRPFWQDRLHANIGSVLSGSQPPLTEEEAAAFPVLNAKIIRKLGLRQPSFIHDPNSTRLEQWQSMDLTAISTGDGHYEGETPFDWTPSTASSSMFDDDAEELPTVNPFPCPGPGVCPVYSRNSGCAYEQGSFDDGHRATNHGFSTQHGVAAPTTTAMVTPSRPRMRAHHSEGSVSDTPGGTTSSASSISLPTPTTIPFSSTSPTFGGLDEPHNLREDNKPGKAATVCGVLSPSMDFDHVRLSVGSNLTRQDSNSSSYGSEVEVEGGVALTEEAVGLGLPDIVTEQ